MRYKRRELRVFSSSGTQKRQRDMVIHQVTLVQHEQWRVLLENESDLLSFVDFQLLLLLLLLRRG